MDIAQCILISIYVLFLCSHALGLALHTYLDFSIIQGTTSSGQQVPCATALALQLFGFREDIKFVHFDPF